MTTVQIQKQQSHLQSFITEIGNTTKNKSLHRILIVFVFVQTEKKANFSKAWSFLFLSLTFWQHKGSVPREGDLVWCTWDLFHQRKGCDTTRIPKFYPSNLVSQGEAAQGALNHHLTQLLWWERTFPQLLLPPSKVSLELLGTQFKCDSIGNRTQI